MSAARGAATLALTAASLAAWPAPPARADRGEATLAVRPVGELARIAERGTDERAVVAGGGLAGAMSWGVRNWLEAGGELSAAAFGEATHDRAMLPVASTPRTGALLRRTRIAQLRAFATLRLGVAWVPTVQLSVGAGVRQRSAGRMRTPGAQGPLVLIPDGEGAQVAPDLLAGLRIGLDHRVNRRWTIGASVGATHCVGIGTPDLQIADVSISLSYSWYHLWW